MKHQTITAIAVALSLGACASNPDKIAAAYVSPSKYQDFDCEQMAREMEPQLAEREPLEPEPAYWLRLQRLRAD